MRAKAVAISLFERLKHVAANYFAFIVYSADGISGSVRDSPTESSLFK